jgi:hypothetical protein
MKRNIGAAGAVVDEKIVNNFGVDGGSIECNAGGQTDSRGNP